MLQNIMAKIVKSALIVFIYCSYATADGVKIINIKIPQKFYPIGFEQDLQNNINYFLDGIGVSETFTIPYDYVVVDNNKISPSDQFNISTVGLYLNLLVVLVQNGDKNAITRLDTVLSVLENIPKWQGMFYWMYKDIAGALKPAFGGISSVVDNGNMAFSLANVNGAFYNHDNTQLQNIAHRAQKLLDNQTINWQQLYDSKRGLLRAGWKDESQGYLGYYIDRKANESRLGALWGAMTVPSIPETAFNNMKLFTGTVAINGQNITPILSWDGSYFQAMMPALWIDESKYIPKYQHFIDFSIAHADYADTFNIPFVSASATVDDGYGAFGLETVSESFRAFKNTINNGKTGTPHALALYYMVNPQDALKRLHRIKSQHPNIQTIAGWADAIDTNGHISKKVIGLDQGMFIGGFIAESVRANVQKYIKYRGYEKSFIRMYKTVVANSKIQ